MLEDRDYMREPEYGDQGWRPGFHLRWSWTFTLVAAYAAVFLAELLTANFFKGQSFIFRNLALSLDGLEHGYVWQLLTYQFMHAGWLHLILNCWVIIMFGRELEALLGVRRYLVLTFSSGVIGGVFQMAAAAVWPSLFGGSVVGASAGAFGLVAAYATLFPERELTMLFYIIPIHLRAKTLLIFSAIVAVMGVIFPWGNVANAAHLGGMAMGWFYVKKILRAPALLGVEEEERHYRSEPAAPVERAADEFQEADVDAVLDKISARGINSLTARERAVLEAARKKMARH